MGFLLILPFLFVIVFGILWLTCIVSCLTKQNVDSNTRIVWLLALIFLPGIGCLLYLLFGPQGAQTQVITATTTDPNGVPQTITYKVEPPKKSRTSSAVVLAGLAIVVLMIAIPAFSGKSARSIIAAKQFRTYQPIQTSSVSHKHPHERGYVADKKSASIVRNIATLQEAFYVEHESYVACDDTVNCNKIFKENFNKELIPAGYSATISVDKNSSGVQNYNIKLWNNTTLNTYVEWDSAKNGMIG